MPHKSAPHCIYAIHIVWCYSTHAHALRLTGTRTHAIFFFCMHACKHARTHACLQTRTHTRTRAHTRTHAHTHTRTHAHTHKHTQAPQTDTHTRTNTHTHTHQKRQQRHRAVRRRDCQKKKREPLQSQYRASSLICVLMCVLISVLMCVFICVLIVNIVHACPATWLWDDREQIIDKVKNLSFLYRSWVIFCNVTVGWQMIFFFTRQEFCVEENVLKNTFSSTQIAQETKSDKWFTRQEFCVEKKKKLLPRY